MPDRVIRDELLESARWLGLRTNAERIAYLALLLTADDFGNLEGSAPRLVRLWREFGCRSPAVADQWLATLADCDLVRIYQVDGKRLIHIPRFHQRLRHFKQRHPPSPWNDSFDQHDAEKTSDARRRSEVNPPLTPARQIRAPNPNPPPDPPKSNGQTSPAPVRDWWMSEEALKRKGEQLGKPAHLGESTADYRARLREVIAQRRGNARPKASRNGK